MRELEGRSYQEIAEILDVSVSAVETLIFRARRALREQLEEGITCHEAELAISRQLDGRLSRKEKSGLRAHLRECGECAHFARSQRAQRGAIKSLALIPLPSSLTSFFHHGGSAASATAGGGAALGGGLALKAAALGAGALVATGVGYEGVKQIRPGSSAPKQVAAPTQAPRAGPTFVATAKPKAVETDLKPSRTASVKARKHWHGRPAVGLARGRVHKEKSPLPPSRGRGHDLKPTNPGRPASPGKSSQHRHQGQVHKRAKPPKKQKPAPPPPPPHGRGGGSGNGQGTGTPPNGRGKNS